jgi:hypothetical protein
MRRIVLPIFFLFLVGLGIRPLFYQGQPVPAEAAQETEHLTPSKFAATLPVLAKDAAAKPAAATQPVTQSMKLLDQAQLPDSDFKTLRGRPGFWRLAQTRDDVWWFLTPNNQLQFMNSVTTVQPYQLARDSGGPNYVSRDWHPDAHGQGDLSAWAQATWLRVHDIGFKGLGGWCNPEFHQIKGVPISRDLNIWSWMSGKDRLLYSPGWEVKADQVVKAQVETLKNNRDLVGYYTDNELNWDDSGAGPGIYFNHLPPNDPNRLQVTGVIRAVWPRIADFNKDWGTHFKHWNDLDHWPALVDNTAEDREAYGRLFAAWLSHLARDYFKRTSALVHKYDPNHLVLGVRFRGYAPLEVVRASRGLTDAQSINIYVGDGLLDKEMFTMIHREAQQPIIITEYSFHALDGRSGDRNTVGFSAQVLDQRARADGYRLMTSRMARVPYIIGGDWFQWMDEPPSGRSSDGEDVNFGIVDVDDRPYSMLTAAIKETTPLLNPLHANSPNDDRESVWRPGFIPLPVAQAPYLSSPPSINGELSDWPVSARLAGVRHSQTIGLERSNIPLPNVYLGWTPKGLYLGMEIFDNDIEGAPNGWWWTRDHVEFFVSTRPVTQNENSYNAYCHQFFFVPQSWPGKDGLTGVIGQWHRPGDAIAKNIVPVSDVRWAARVLSNRYVVEMFIPASALHGWDPVHHPTMAFNIHVRNYQHALDYFWSAPKEVRTELRPSTWGTLQLLPPPTAAVSFGQ